MYSLRYESFYTIRHQSKCCMPDRTKHLFIAAAKLIFLLWNGSILLNFCFQRYLFSKLVLVSLCLKKDPLDNLLLESKHDRQSDNLISSVAILLYECYEHVWRTRITVVY